jgi:hypothetical protein
MSLLAIALLLLIAYGSIGATAQDPLWFVQGFAAWPQRVFVYHGDGRRTEVRPGQPGFDELAWAIRSSLAQGVDGPSGIGFSDASLLDAYTRFVTVEAVFKDPVKLHAWFYTGEATQMLLPITGRHAELSVVLLGTEGRYRSNPPVLKTMEPIRRALESLGYYPPH